MNADELKALLAQDELKKVAEGLTALCKGTRAEKEAFLLSSRLAKTERDWNLGALSREHYQLEINSIRQGMLHLLDHLPKRRRSIKQPTLKRRWIPWWSILLVTAALAALLVCSQYYFSQEPLPTSAIEGEKIPERLRKELVRLQQEGEYIKDVAINPNQSGVVLYGLNRYYWQDIPKGLQLAMESFAQGGSELKQVTLGPHGEWLFLLDYNGYWQDRVPQPLTQMLDTLRAQRREIEQVAMGANYEWLVLYDYNGYASENIPQAAFDAIVSFNSQGKEIRRAAWGGDPVSWVVLGVEEASFSENADPQLKKAVFRAIAQRQRIRTLLILPNSGWLLLRDGE